MSQESENIAEAYEREWFGFDTENDETGRVTLACLINENGEKWIWKEAGHFVEWCETREEPAMVICHNLEYDLVNEFGEKYAYLNHTYLKGRLISSRYKKITFWDSFNHFRMPLKDIGEALGIKKPEMDIYSEEYVATDAWICLKIMTRARDYIASLGGSIGATSGSSAVSIWRVMTQDEYMTGPLDTEWLRRGYYGGRTEIFMRKSEGVVRGYDINSMYPFCMLYEYPEYMLEDSGMDKGKGMAEATVQIPLDTYVPSLVYRDKVTKRLIYPVGVFTGVWSYDELRYMEGMGGQILKIHSAYGCNCLVKPFTEFVQTLYAKRKASSDKAEVLFLKVLMNSLYGKIASKNTVTRTVSRHTLLNSSPNKVKDVKWINHNRGLLDYKAPQQPFVNVAWGSMITAYARLLMTDYLIKCPPEKLIYCDTDCIYCVDHELPISKELGGLKLEKEARTMFVPQPKAYAIDDFYRAKGVPRPKLDKEGNIIVDYARNYIEDGMAEFMLPIRFRQSLNSKRGKANQWINMSKSMRSEYKHKRLSKNRYYPPVIGHQMELTDQLEKKKG